jgi:hypothetical protein
MAANILSSYIKFFYKVCSWVQEIKKVVSGYLSPSLIPQKSGKNLGYFGKKEIMVLWRGVDSRFFTY